MSFLKQFSSSHVYGELIQNGLLLLQLLLILLKTRITQCSEGIIWYCSISRAKALNGKHFLPLEIPPTPKKGQGQNFNK